eukprot:TRINITY_DN33046_c0_g1_i1.p1 TRINITY_DN33046_c0_g1~~TRINITY_DN33046_c0_g1_i1.p1  ORF type:complete len:108 (-),score=21.49 TRINITY_DN33046_c0_g1_i1:633-956(-)
MACQPYKENGVVTDIEKVVKRRTKTLLHIDNSLGFSGSTFSPGAYGDALIIEAQAERKNFAKAINFLSDAINYPHLTTVKSEHNRRQHSEQYSIIKTVRHGCSQVPA